MRDFGHTRLVAVSIATALLLLLCSCGGGGGTGSATSGSGMPQITSLSPDSGSAEDAPFELTVKGSGFQSGSSVLWNGTVLPTTYVSAVQLTAEVPSADLVGAGTAKHQGAQSGAGRRYIARGASSPSMRRTAVQPSLLQFASTQTKDADFANDSTVQFQTPTKTGDAIWVAVTVADFGGVHAITVSDTQGNTYTLLDQKNDGLPGTQTVAHFYARNIVGDTGTPDTITVHWGFDNYKGVLAG